MEQGRRRVLRAAAASLAAPALLRRAWAAEAGTPLPMPAIVDVDGVGPARLEAVDGLHDFGAGRRSTARGFNQPYLGPLLRMRRGGSARIDVHNRLQEAITVHWHGLHVPGEVDGGPHAEIAPGAIWKPTLEIDQPACTAWYHSHRHGHTAPHVYAGLAGMLIVDDPRVADPGLPRRLGVDDLPLVLQDRMFGADGRLHYPGGMMAMMAGVRGDQMLVNGAIRPVADVPAGIVRLRLLNACNARILHLHLDDGRPLQRIGSDGGLLARPVAERMLVLAPGERAEVLVDCATDVPAAGLRLLSLPDANRPRMGMMGGGMGRGMGMTGAEPAAVAAGGAFEVLRLRADAGREGAVRTLPLQLLHAAPAPQLGEPQQRRRFVLDSMGGMMGGGMGRGMGRGGMGMMAMTINGRPFDMDRIDLTVRRGDTELWEVQAGDMAHPFHVHGTSFQVLSVNGRPVDFAATGWKDTVLVDGRAELLMRFQHKAGPQHPYMFHCHILEHEDAGMMGQFSVA
jgi:FtsP/CotA-like multicopper oxidase with cupredoxin domain